MSFVVLLADVDAGSVSAVQDRGFATYEEAMTALQAHGKPTSGQEAYVIDLGESLPITFFGTVVSDEEPSAVDTIAEDDVQAAGMEVDGPRGTLAYALRRAADSMVAEGIKVPDSWSRDIDTLTEEQTEEKMPITSAYKPGESDIDTYTCDDCIYAGTCSKRDQEGPKTCGSFHWRSC